MNGTFYNGTSKNGTSHNRNLHYGTSHRKFLILTLQSFLAAIVGSSVPALDFGISRTAEEHVARYSQAPYLALMTNKSALYFEDFRGFEGGYCARVESRREVV